MLWLADFVLDSDMCLPDGQPSLRLTDPKGAYEIELSNLEPSAEFAGAALAARLTFNAGDSDGIRGAANANLAEALSFLTYVTSRKFAYRSLRQIIEWTPGKIERQAIIYCETPENDYAEPALGDKYIKTAETLMRGQTRDEQLAAMRWYRLGIQADISEEQFQYFWFALEIVAEAVKDTVKVPSKCPRCRTSLYCESCGEYPVHRPYAQDAIHRVVHQVHPEDSEQVFLTLQKIRHTLMHGRTLASVENSLPCTTLQAINKLAQLTWDAIALMFPNPDEMGGTKLNFGYVENVVRRTVVASMHVITTLSPDGDPDVPRIEHFPTMSFKAVRR